MIRFIKQKLIHKKWMVVCLLIGNILLAAIASSNPMYQDAALEKTLKSKYSNYIEETNKDPGVITFNSMLNSGKANGGEFKQMQDTANGAAESLGVDQKYLVSLFETSKVRGEFEQSRGNKTTTKSMRIAMMSDMKGPYLCACRRMLWRRASGRRSPSGDSEPACHEQTGRRSRRRDVF